MRQQQTRFLVLDDLLIEMAEAMGQAPAEFAAIALGENYAEFVAYLRATGIEITTMRRLDTAMHRFGLSQATAAAMARLDAELEEAKVATR